jgi:hypothetical protein
MSHHRVRRHVWSDGILQTFDEIFSSIEQALEYANGQAASHVKIYDENDQVTHVLGPVLHDTYA